MKLSFYSMPFGDQQDCNVRKLNWTEGRTCLRGKTFQTQNECSISSVPLSHDSYKEHGSTLSTGVDSPAERCGAGSDDLWTFPSLIRLY